MKTWEMIQKLSENPGLKAIDETGYIVSINKNDDFCHLGEDGILLNLSDEWQIMQESVSWQEAIQAKLDGKNVYFIEEDGSRYKLTEFLDNFRTSKWYIED